MYNKISYKNLFFIFALLILVSNFCIAEEAATQSAVSEQQTTNVPFVSDETVKRFEETFAILEKEFMTDYLASGSLTAPNPKDIALIVEGANTNGIEKAFLYFAAQNYPVISELDKVSEKDITYDEVINSKKIILLFGGPSQNKITDKLLEEKLITKLDHPSESTIAIYQGRNRAGAKLVVISDLRGFENIARMDGAENSPLAQFMSAPAVIATASLFSVLIAAFWAKIWGACRVLFAKLITGKKKSTLSVDHTAKSMKISGFEIKYREVLAILIGMSAYTIAVTVAATGLKIKFYSLFAITFMCGLIFFSIREGFRLLICYFKDLNTEYIIWWPGAVFTVFTGWLGNTLNTPGIIVEHKDKEVKFEKYAFVKYLVVFGTLVISIILFVYNIFHPSKGVQIFAIISSTYAAAEIMPFKPMPGKDIWKWKPVLYVFTFIIILTSYVMFNFVI